MMKNKKSIFLILVVVMILTAFCSCLQSNEDIVESSNGSSIINDIVADFNIDDVKFKSELESESGARYQKYLDMVENDVFTIDISIYGIGDRILNTYYTRDNDNIYQLRTSVDKDGADLIKTRQSLMLNGKFYTTIPGVSDEVMIAQEEVRENQLIPGTPFIEPEKICFQKAYYVTNNDREYICEEWFQESGNTYHNMKMYFSEDTLIAVRCEGINGCSDTYINKFDNTVDKTLFVVPESEETHIIP